MVLLFVGCAEESTKPTHESTPTRPIPESTPTVSAGPPPSPHIEGQPHGLGVTNQMVVDALVPRGFAFEQYFNSVLQRPAVRGSASLGPPFNVNAVGSPRGVIEFGFWTYWSGGAQPPISAMLSIVDLVTPNWEGASEWVRKQVTELSGQDGVTRRTSSGNYVVSVSTLTYGEAPGIQVSVSPRFASCADALAAQDWTTEGSVGNERGYAQWRVPSEPDPDDDGTVCESIRK